MTVRLLVCPQSSGTRLAFYFFLWYAFNIIFNIFNKSTLNIFPYPWFISTLQLAAGVLYVSMLWLLRLQPLPKARPHVGHQVGRESRRCIVLGMRKYSGGRKRNLSGKLQARMPCCGPRVCGAAR